MSALYPRYGRFIGTGAVLGVLAALLIVLLVPHDGGAGAFVRVAVLTTPLSGLLGALVAVLASATDDRTADVASAEGVEERFGGSR